MSENKSPLHSYDVHATSAAPPSAVWDLLVHPRTWPAWAPLEELVEERSELRPDGTREIGQVQAFRVGDGVNGERLTELVPEQRMSYEDAFNNSLHDYRASVELTPSGSGTEIHWHGTYRTRPELDEFMPDFLQGYMQQMADGLAAYAVNTAPPATEKE